jgi:hypothetical protein
MVDKRKERRSRSCRKVQAENYSNASAERQGKKYEGQEKERGEERRREENKREEWKQNVGEGARKRRNWKHKEIKKNENTKRRSE